MRCAGETWAQLSGAWSSAAEATFDKRIYEAAVASLVEVVHGFDEDTRTALLLGHNPGVHGLVVTLAGQGDEGARALAAVGFPTSGVAVLSVPGRWSKLGAGKATLTTFTVPRG